MPQRLPGAAFLAADDALGDEVHAIHAVGHVGVEALAAVYLLAAAAACAARAILLADGRVIADGPTSELLAGGWYFATETARILGGAEGALLPEDGAGLLAERTLVEVAL